MSSPTNVLPYMTPAMTISVAVAVAVAARLRTSVPEAPRLMFVSEMRVAVEPASIRNASTFPDSEPPWVSFRS